MYVYCVECFAHVQHRHINTNATAIVRVGGMCVPVGACVSSVIPLFFDVFLPDICLICVYEGGDFFV